MTDTAKSLQRNTATALFYTAALLTTYEYWLLPPRAEGLLQGKPIGSWALPPSLQAGLIWAVACLVGYMVLPVLWVWLQHHRWRALGELGFSARGFLKHLRVYLGLYALMVPVIYIASLSPHFTAIYPFIPAAKQSLSSFIAWELAYLAQFFALESFFRGTLLFTLERSMGSVAAVAAMTVPYAMIHFHKPPHEAFGAILAGALLGTLALRYRSWLGGAILHSLVALTMDTLASGRSLGLWN